jgi:hypothetical protein
VDGDQRLWLRARQGLTVVVLGFQGEPYLRFSPAGVDVNESSPAYYLNRTRPRAVPAGLDAFAPPRWHRLGPGQTYSWHEDRLHALAASARRPGSDFAGSWMIPVRIEGRRTQLAGSLLYSADPSWVWFWPVAVVLVSLVALPRLRSRRLDTAASTVLAAATLTAFVVGRAGRDLYGRPAVSARELVGLGLTLLFTLVLAVGLRSSDWRGVAALVTGVAGVYEGLALIGTLLHGHVLSALPASVERAAAAACLAGGAGLLLVALVGEGTSDQQLRVQARERVLSLKGSPTAR